LTYIRDTERYDKTVAFSVFVMVVALAAVGKACMANSSYTRP
jgi:hypothetical protein